MLWWTSLPLKGRVPRSSHSQSWAFAFTSHWSQETQREKSQKGEFFFKKNILSFFLKMRKGSFISSKNRPFCGKKKREKWWLIKQHSEFQACQDTAVLNGKDDPKTPGCLKINKRTLASCSAFLFVVMFYTLPVVTFLTRFIAHSWIYSAAICWEPPCRMYETRT